MPRYRFLTTDVFTDRVFGGNPLAVFPQADNLTTDQMQRTAGELNLSETVFVFPPDRPDHTARLRIFTPRAELPFAGHPTVGTAFVLASIGRIPLTGARTAVVLEEGVGPVAVSIAARDGRPTAAQLTAARLPELGPAVPGREDSAAVLSLGVSDLADGRAPRGASCGVPYFFIPLRDRAALARARLDRAVWDRAFSSAWAPHLFPYTLDAGDSADVRARMFAPALGIVEDPATGSAAAAMAGLLAPQLPDSGRVLRFVIDQGVEMGRPSRMEVEADRDGTAISAVRVGGASVLVSEGTMEIPE